jgi:hypothetical protein
MASDKSNQPWAGQHYIAGEWRESAGERFEAHNPARSAEITGIYPRGGAARLTPPWRRPARRLPPGGEPAA